MIRKSQPFLNFLNIASDFLLITLSYPLAVYTRLELLNGKTHMLLLSLPYYILAGCCALLTVFVYYILGLYSSQRLKQNTGDLFQVPLVNGIVTLGAMALLYLTRIMEFPRLAMVLFWIFSSLLVIVKRTLCWIILRRYRSLGYNQKHIAIVGNGHLAKQYLQGVKDQRYRLCQQSRAPGIGNLLGQLRGPGKDPGPAQAGRACRRPGTPRDPVHEAGSGRSGQGGGPP